jgi:integrase
VRAQKEVARLDAELARYWRDLAAGRNPEGLKRAQWAVDTAKRFGFPYVELAELDAGPLGELVKRLLALEPFKEPEREKVLPALWGHHPKPVDGTLLSDMADIYASLRATLLMRKSPEQNAKWRGQRGRALSGFIDIIGGDKRIVELTADDVEQFKDFWKKRVLDGEVAVDTANKNIGRVAAMVREISEEKKLKLEDLFARSHIKGGEDKQRAAFDPRYVQDVLLADGVMDGLNDEARAIFYVVAETGMRPSEVAGLTLTTICLDHEVPHVKLTEDGRTLKNKNSKRTMPLVGVALEVMRYFPDGFPRYRNRTACLSTTINQYLRKNGLCPKEGQSFYSLRHTFKDRLRGADPDQELRDVLMGHATGK